MPGGTAHTAGGEKLVDVGVAEALRTIRPHDFLHVHKMPCFRDSYLYGMGGGFLVGGGMWIVGKPLRKIPNYVFGTTIGIAMVAYAWCHSERQREKRGMRMVVDVMEQKQMEKKGKLDEFMEKKRVADEARRADEGKTEDKKKGWWRYWEGREGKDITYRGREG
jgi:cytochrome c oxidase assembly protein subunit 20